MAQRLCAVLGAVIVPSLLICSSAASAAGSSAAPTTRTVTDAQSGQSVVITDEGQCGKTTARVTTSAYRDVDVRHDLVYNIDSKCNVSVTRGTSGSAAQASASSASVPSEERRYEVTAKTSGLASASVIYGNIIHSSQTLQDVVNIDISKYQYGHDRVWDNVGWSYFKTNPIWMTASTSVRWNHPSGNPGPLGFDNTWTYNVAGAAGIAAFHSDFLWCNFQPGQNYVMTTGLASYWNGGYSASYYQGRVCSGTHMATATKANTTAGAF